MPSVVQFKVAFQVSPRDGAYRHQSNSDSGKQSLTEEHPEVCGENDAPMQLPLRVHQWWFIVGSAS